MQIPSSTVAEVMGDSGYDWIAIDLEHGSFSINMLPDIFRALELGDTLPLVRLLSGSPEECKQVLDAGAGGVIIPMIESSEQLKKVRDSCRWPPSGNRGVAFSRANLFGKNFNNYIEEAQNPFLVAMIENIKAVDDLSSILKVGGLDAILIGPYDLSASMGIISEFENPKFIKIMDQIYSLSKEAGIPCGVHIVDPMLNDLIKRIEEGYRFLPYSIDSVFLNKSVVNPINSIDIEIIKPNN